MNADQPEATTTAARVLSDAEIDFLRSDYAEWVVTEFDPDVILRLLATLDAAVTARYQAEQWLERDAGAFSLVLDETQAALAAERIARQQAERLHAAAWQHIQISERYLGGEIEKERQARERAEAALATEREKIGFCACGQPFMHPLKPMKDWAVGETHTRMTTLTYGGTPELRLPDEYYEPEETAPSSSQAAPHEPPAGGGGVMAEAERTMQDRFFTSLLRENAARAALAQSEAERSLMTDVANTQRKRANKAVAALAASEASQRALREALWCVAVRVDSCSGWSQCSLCGAVSNHAGVPHKADCLLATAAPPAADE